MPDIAAMTRAEREEALAERVSVPCSICKPFVSNPDFRECRTCGGTGREWPLREPCFIRFANNTLAPEAHRHCDGGCLVSKEMHLEDLLLLMPGRPVVWFGPGDNEPKWIAQCGARREFWAEASTPLEAAERAFLEALEAPPGATLTPPPGGRRKVERGSQYAVNTSA